MGRSQQFFCFAINTHHKFTTKIFRNRLTTNIFTAAVFLASVFARTWITLRRRAVNDLPPAVPAQWTPHERHRWRHYVYGTTYLAAVFTLLRGAGRTRAEERLFGQLAALAGYFDDLSDRETALNRQDNPEQYGRAVDPGGRALLLLETLYRTLPPEHLPQFKTFLHRVFHVETGGRQRAGTDLPLAELRRLSAEKGGCSVLLFRRLLSHPLPEREETALFEFGALIQLCDDIFDLWFDRQQGIATLATTLAGRGDLRQLREIFEDQVMTTARAFRQMPYPRRRVETALCAVHFLVAITRVCLRHYFDLQKKRGTLPLDDRRAMVVDMERWKNRLRAGVELLNKPL